jgi:hypothetical protein
VLIILGALVWCVVQFASMLIRVVLP